MCGYFQKEDPFYSCNLLIVKPDSLYTEAENLQAGSPEL